MKRSVLSLVAAGSFAVSPLFMAGPAFASDNGSKDEGRSNTSLVCSNTGLLQLNVVCIGSIAIPVIVNVLSGSNILSGGSAAVNKTDVDTK